MDFARKSLLGKARSRPDLVKQVVRKLRQEGPLPTYRAVMNRLDAPQPLGYSCAGVVEAVGPTASPASRRAIASPAPAPATRTTPSSIVVPENLVGARARRRRRSSRPPSRPSARSRCRACASAQPTLGEVAAVIGLGLIGQLAVQLLRANGCRVLGIDLDPTRVKQALDQGAEWGAAPGDDLDRLERRGRPAAHGVDLALVTAASESSAPIQLAAELCRHEGPHRRRRRDADGARPPHLLREGARAPHEHVVRPRPLRPRATRRSASTTPSPTCAGPRTATSRPSSPSRRAASVEPGALDAETLPFDEAVGAYDDLARGERRSLAVVFRYDGAASARPRRSPLDAATRRRADRRKAWASPSSAPATTRRACCSRPSAACKDVRARRARHGDGRLGAAHGREVRLRALRHRPRRRARATPPSTSSSSPRGTTATPRWPPRRCAPARPSGSRSPSASTDEEVDAVAAAARETRRLPHRRLQPPLLGPRPRRPRGLRGPQPVRWPIHYAVVGRPDAARHLDHRSAPRAAGASSARPATSSTSARYLVGAPPRRVFARALGRDPETDDSIVSPARLPGRLDGDASSTWPRASAELPKERFEASADGRTARCDNFRVTTLLGGPRAGRVKTLNQDKGQATAVAEVVEAVRAGGPSPFSLDEIVAVSRATFAMLESARSGRLVEVTP